MSETYTYEKVGNEVKEIETITIDEVVNEKIKPHDELKNELLTQLNNVNKRISDFTASIVKGEEEKALIENRIIELEKVK